MPADAAFAAIADTLISAFTYDSTAARFRSDAPGRPGVLNDLALLRVGDGIWLSMAAATTWAQDG